MFALLNIKNLTEQFKTFIPKITPGVTEWDQHIRQSTLWWHAQTIRLHIRKQDIHGIFCSWCLTQSSDWTNPYNILWKVTWRKPRLRVDVAHCTAWDSCVSTELNSLREELILNCPQSSWTLSFWEKNQLNAMTASSPLCGIHVHIQR